MKKFIFILLLTLIICVTYYSINIQTVLQDYEDAKIIVFTNEKINLGNGVKKNGIGYKTILPLSELNTLNNLEIRGINYQINGNIQDVNNILSKLKADCIGTQKIDNLTIIYAYTTHFKSYELYKGQKMNVQIAYDGQKILIGMPIILGSY